MASYRDFAKDAETDSPTFGAWAAAVAADPEVCSWIRTLPGIKQQPNLVFAAARWHGVPAPGPYAGLREALLEALPTVGWRGGVDLRPLDVTDADQVAWLEQLIWPEHDDRRTRLRQAVALARTDPAQIVQGDLLTELPALVEKASAYGTVVVFHSAVIAYLKPADRERFDQMMRGLVAAGACHWVSNEGKNVLPSVTATGPAIPAAKPTFVLGVDGQAVAHTHGHGRSMRWLST